MQLSRVDLPQPEGPSRTMNSPWLTSRSSDSRTLTRAEVERQVFDLKRWTASLLPLHRAGGDAADEQLARNEIDDERHERR